MTQYSTIADFIFQYPPHNNDKVALTFLDHSGVEKTSFTYESLKDNCIVAAKNLRLESRKQVPVLILVEDQADFVLAFFGCVLAGFIPAPLPPLRNHNDKQSFGRALSILKEGTVRSLIVPEKDAGRIKGILLDAGLENINVWPVESLKRPIQSEVKLPDIQPDDIAYIQYTSGSTSTPSGVQLKHRNVVAQMEMMHRVFARKAIPVVAGWIPFHHDMGLVGHLFTALFESGSGVFFPASAFLSTPLLWLDVIHKYRATACAAPTFAYELCTRRAPQTSEWDLSCWEQAYAGSETVSLKVLQDFTDAFGPAGFSKSSFRPVYGLAEATLLAAGGSLSLDQLEGNVLHKKFGTTGTRQLIPYTLEEGCTIRIKDLSSGQDLGENTEGEIWIKGPAVPAAYFGAAPENRLEGNGVRTGDLGMISGKQLFITGRKKELVIIRGVNYSAEDLETAVRAGDTAIRSHDRTACVSHIADDGEQFWVFQEVHRHISPKELQELFTTIQGNLSEEFGIIAHKVIFLPQGLMPKTANYKISRRQCEEMFCSGTMKPLAVLPLSEDTAAQPQENQPDRVVVVSMACRFPGGADSPEKFWDLLANGMDAITEVPSERWDNNLFYDKQASVPGKVNTKWAGFLDNIADFDPALFGISNFEAPEIDPQQRLLLETSWRLIERTGWKKEDLAGSPTGVYIGISTNDYLYMKIKLMPGMESFNAYSGLGNANSVAANRLSYFYDLKGPSLAVDTACSSSLTAFHLGARAILNGECKQAIVGGVNAILSPGPTITLSQFGMMSPEGRCKAFDAGADGYVRSEGCGLVMLKLESAALADGDRILAIVNATTLGQDGASTGMTYPNGAAQYRLLRNGLEAAGLKGSDISYIEAHGTGTRAGDPVEMEQIRTVFGATNDAPCYVGSVKANLGHLEASAGIASVIKTVLMLNRKQVPPQIHLKQLNPQIRLDHTRLEIATALTNWNTPGHVHRAAINSFGFGGSLANVILEEALPEAHTRKGMGQTGFFHLPFVISGHSPEGLRAQIAHVCDWIKTGPDITWSDLCFSYAAGRSALKYKAYFLAYSLKSLHEKLTSWLDLTPAIAAESQAGICYLFTGQGEHFLRMGKELYHHCTVFRDAFDRCAAAVDVPGQTTTKEYAFQRDTTDHWTDDIMQPIHFAIQYSLGILWMECGIAPQVMLGHSLGEYAAACLAGCFEPETGMKILRRRGELVNALPVNGIMATLFMNHEEVRKELNPALASIAAINSPAKTVISGHAEEVNRLMRICESKGLETYYLKTQHAFHSALVEPMIDQFRKELSPISFKPPKKKWISSLRASVMTEAPDADYWIEHLRNTVQFAKGVELLKAEGPLHYIEVGPGASTLAALRECTGGGDSMLLRSLTFKKGDRTESFYFLDSIGKLFAAGMRINWEVILPGNFVPHLVPGQVFMHRPYWMAGMDASKFASHISPAAVPQRQVSAPVNQLQYKLVWTEAGKLADLPQQLTSLKPVTWIVAGEGPLALSLLSVLREAKQPAFWVATAATDDRKLKPTVQLPAHAGPQDWHAALARIKDRESRADVAEWKMIFIEPDSGEPAYSKNNRGLELLIPLVHAIRSTALLSSLWVVTHDTQVVSNGKPAKHNIGSAVTWGFGKTLFLEHPELRGGLIDLSETDDTATRAKTIISKVLTPQFEHAVAIRSGRQFIQQIVSAPASKARHKMFRDDGVFIITGGFGGLGLKCAEWAISRGARRIIIASRKKLPAKSEWRQTQTDHEHYSIIRQIIRLEDKGAQIEAVALDVCDATAISGLFSRLDNEGTPVRGILHAAGVNWFSKVIDLDLKRFFETLKIKVAATWELHRHTMNRDLDCFILFSSVSALWGSVDLSHYTAANQFMDALSIYRGHIGLPSLSIDWGPWAEVGMSAHPAEKDLLEKLGFSLLPPDQALAAMDTSLASGDNVRLVADINWLKFQPFIDFCLQPSLFANMAAQPVRSNSSSQKIQARILESDPAEARRLIEEVVRVELRTVTLIESTDAIDADHRFNFMGMDSLMAISYVSTLENYFQLRLPSTLTYNYPTIRALSDYLFQLLYKPAEKAVHTYAHTVIANGEPQAAYTQADIAERWFVPLNEVSSGIAPRLYCFPFAGSGISAFAGWVPLTGKNVELVGIQNPGREERADERPFTRMTDLITELLSAFPEQTEPYYLFGHSLGALMAYEFVLALQSAGRKLPDAIIVSGCDAPLKQSEGRIHQLDADQFIQEVVSRFELHQPNEDRIMALRENQSLLRADIELLETYIPTRKEMHVPLTVICGTEDPMTEASRMKDWIKLANSDFSIAFVEGSHNLVTENKSDLVRIIRESMRFTNYFELQPL